jgi:hypothetical protein
MGEKTPDTDASSIERRDVLKGLGLGAMSLAGVGAMSGAVVAQASPVNVGLTPTGEDLEDDSLGGSPPQVRSDLNTVDLVAYMNMNQDDPSQDPTIGTQLTILSRQSGKVVTQAFEEGTSESTAGVKATTPSGIAEMRHTFSVENLSSGQQYVAVLSVIDYSDVSSASGGMSDVATVYAQPFQIQA